MTTEELAKELISGNRRALAKAITLVESTRTGDKSKANELLSQLQASRDTIRVGISGVPGVGKSTFIESLGNFLIEKGHKVAVLAVDPSSPSTGGSILGDKTRMETLSSKEEAFIRPSPTSGTLGGVAKKTREAMMLCEAAGYDVILIETVGVGQSEFEVASMVDCFLVMMLPGGGDSLQGIKRGILEITDILVVNKADGDQKKLAEQARSEYQNAFHLLSPKIEGVEVAFQIISAIEGRGISETWEAVESFISTLKKKKLFNKFRNEQEINWFKRLAEDALIEKLWNEGEQKGLAEDLINRIRKNEMSPSAAAAMMASKMNENNSK